MATDLKTPAEAEVDIGDYQYGFHDPVDKYVFTARKGLDRDIVSLGAKDTADRVRSLVDLHDPMIASRFASGGRASFRSIHGSSLPLSNAAAVT